MTSVILCSFTSSAFWSDVVLLRAEGASSCHLARFSLFTSLYLDVPLATLSVGRSVRMAPSRDEYCVA